MPSSLLFLLNLLSVYCLYPSEIDYCNLRCKGKKEKVSTGCWCKHKGDDREEVLDDLDEFRKAIVDNHNSLRNKIARGDEESKGYPKAADMKALNYDFELEHTARCYLISNYTQNEDNCRMTSFCYDSLGPGQSGAGSKEKMTDGKKTAEYVAAKFYGELDWILEADRKTVIEKFGSVKYKKELIPSKEEATSEHFTQLVWSNTTRIGCARLWWPSNKHDGWQMIILCNYAGPKNNQKCAGNIKGEPVYKIGNPCSICGIVYCNNNMGGKHDALCGEVKPIPKYDLKPISRWNEDNKKNNKYDNKDNKEGDKNNNTKDGDEKMDGTTEGTTTEMDDGSVENGVYNKSINFLIYFFVCVTYLARFHK